MKKVGEGGPSTRELCGEGLEVRNSEAMQEPLASRYEAQGVKFTVRVGDNAGEGQGASTYSKQMTSLSLEQ